MAMLVCTGCGGRNPVDAATCAFCQHPLGAVRRRSSRLAGWRPGLRVALLLMLLVLIGVVLVLVSRGTPLLASAT
jgi:hypothetical protein